MSDSFNVLFQFYFIMCDGLNSYGHNHKCNLFNENKQTKTRKASLPHYEYVGHDFDGDEESIYNPVHHPLHLQTLLTTAVIFLMIGDTLKKKQF